ncbi:CDP-glycerol glycerophosphotransferase family protein [Macrococcus armenti]|uniref:CDP-glycerol glycerophosphotransferase family protein n=1 Tax=Macrococcus armenti TaxID=2875764 RepID=UPI001CCD5A62|nr:CDP-glycerol glycerophosphotransferase family protein [Macrococcus armenti]UBH16109.1 CDP-glycerol glycerophosphotransferase family protein [Macrococcus armenti]UBH18469.1 CDP-glycerol glycerophosphotransferase family protein [Macrococcus armenti]UBH20736.1 CDP-glycerol glycerophosphotransferase family protein [Macrococcus armenti]
MKIKNILIFENNIIQTIPRADTIIKFINNLETFQSHEFKSIENIIIIPKNLHKHSYNYKTYVYHSFDDLIALINTQIVMDDYSHVYFPNTYKLDDEINYPSYVHQYITNDLSQNVFTKEKIGNIKFNADNIHYYRLDFLYKYFDKNLSLKTSYNLYDDILFSRDIPTLYKCNYTKSLLQLGINILEQESSCIEQYIDKILSIHLDPSNDELIPFYILCNNELEKYYKIKRDRTNRLFSIQSTLNNSLMLFALLNETRTALRAITRILKDYTKFSYSLYEIKTTHLPLIKNTFVFESFNGRGYSDNPKYIYEYLYKKYPEYQYFWIVNDLNVNIPGPAIKIKRFSKEYFDVYARSEYWISNTRLPSNLKKRAGQTYIQTWHGTPLKKLVLDMESVKLPNTTTLEYKLKFLKESERWDYLISPNDYSTDIFTRCFNVPKSKILTTGYPRNEMLQKRKDDKIYCDNLKRKLSIDNDKKVILYAPTWRDSDYSEEGGYAFNLQFDLKAFINHTDENTVLLLRLHYLIAEKINLPDHPRIINVSDYDDIADLYLITDLLITDYSSVFFDFSILNRPIIFFSYDIDLYRDELRGFYLDYYNDLPGPICKTNEELITSINQLLNNYNGLYNEYFYSKLNKYEDGYSSIKLINNLIK